MVLVTGADSLIIGSEKDVSDELNFCECKPPMEVVRETLQETAQAMFPNENTQQHTCIKLFINPNATKMMFSIRQPTDHCKTAS